MNMASEQKSKLNIVIAEDHAVIRKLLRMEVERHELLELAGETGDGLEVIQLVENMRPDILVIDIRLPGLNGIEAVRKIKAEFPVTRVIVMSMYDDDAHIYDALSAGAMGYVVKSRINDLPEAIETVSAGRIFLTPPITLDRIEAYRRNTNKPSLNDPEESFQPD
jgi:DNA-binding NarL/FixJ family response regulator